jgi:hypothetical protein
VYPTEQRFDAITDVLPRGARLAQAADRRDPFDIHGASQMAMYGDGEPPASCPDDYDSALDVDVGLLYE